MISHIQRDNEALNQIIIYVGRHIASTKTTKTSMIVLGDDDITMSESSATHDIISDICMYVCRSVDLDAQAPTKP